MFFIALTKQEIAQNFHSEKIEEFKINSFIVTIVTDQFLSAFFSESNGFSIVESPLISSSGYQNVIFSQLTYHCDKEFLTIFKSTISGRPIYYHINSKGEFFCSTHISLLKIAGVPIEENIDVLPEFFVYRFVMPPNTLYKNIEQLCGGGQLQIKIENDKCRVHPTDYYNPTPLNQKIKSIKNGSEILYNYLSESIKKLDCCKDELAILLSGGIESSIISKICKKNFTIDRSYSTGYPFESPLLNVEKRYALSAAAALGMQHSYYEPTTHEYLLGFIEAISLAEEPLHHLQSPLLHLLMKNKIPKNEKIVLCGQGGGSSFGGNYYFYINENKDNTFFRLLTTKPVLGSLKVISQFVGKGEEIIDILSKATSDHVLSDPNNPMWSWMRYGNKEWVCKFFNVKEENIIKNRFNVVKQIFNNNIYDLWSLYSLFSDEEITLNIWSKIGEGNKKILYYPFYDSTVLNCVFSIPWDLKLRGLKDILRKEIARQSNIPEFMIKRTKSSFGIRSRRWAKKGGVFEPLIPLCSKVFDEKEIRKMQSSDSNMMIFWNILNYSIWKRLCIYDEPLEVLLEEVE